MQTQSCKYGDACAFAHGEEQLRKKVHVPSMYKTKLCQAFHDTGSCPYGNRCQFIHSDKIGDILQKTETTTLDQLGSLDLKQIVSYKQMLRENADCIEIRISSSQNPYLNEFNLVYKEVNTRLPIFDRITSEHGEEGGDLPSVKLQKLNAALIKEYLKLEEQI